MSIPAPLANRSSLSHGFVFLLCSLFFCTAHTTATPACGHTDVVGIAPTVHADSPFLRGSAGVTASAATAANAGDGPASDRANQDEPAVLALGPRTVTVAPGANAILELAIDHLNRIVTPFERPSVRTVSELSTEVEGKVVYVATASEVPATLYISAGDAAGTTIALTLAPRRVPPREIRLQVPGYQATQAQSKPMHRRPPMRSQRPPRWR